MEHFDLIVIGGGAAGITSSRGPAAQGWKIAMIEKDFMGGTCTNVGCMPTKALLASVHLLHAAKHADAYALQIPEASGEWLAVRKRMDQFVAKLRSGSENYPKQFDNMKFYRGIAKFIDRKTISVGGEEISGDRIIIAAGARSFIPPIPGIEDIDYLTSTTALALPSLPDLLTILGGGVLSVEFAQIFARLGSKVTIVEQNEQILGGFDDDLAAELKSTLEEEGIRVLTGHKVVKLSKDERSTNIFISNGDDQQVLHSSKVLVATGRKPNSDYLDLHRAGVQLDSRGFISIDTNFMTNIQGIYAIGDIIGGAMFTHKARHDGMLLSDHLLTGNPISHHKDRIIPSAVFTDPEIAIVGETEKSAGEKGYSFSVRKLPYSNIGRAGATSKPKGFIKILLNNHTRHIIGSQIIGANAGEIVHTVMMCMRLKGTIFDLQDMLPIHPTFAEGLYSAAMLFERKPS